MHKSQIQGEGGAHSGQNEGTMVKHFFTRIDLLALLMILINFLKTILCLICSHFQILLITYGLVLRISYSLYKTFFTVIHLHPTVVFASKAETYMSGGP
jgi:hypothetical protein